ncbi:putative protein isoform c protein [Lasiodiplodia theobromae]|nr:putative protein isoform c protein [Lasiodiplodia theobromae]
MPLSCRRTKARTRFMIPVPLLTIARPDLSSSPTATTTIPTPPLPYVCCGRSYGSKYTFTRHRRESRTCPYGSGGRRFVCYICANTDQPFSRRASLKQHVQEVHRRSPEEANVEVDTWYGRYGDEKDYPDTVRDLGGPY